MSINMCDTLAAECGCILTKQTDQGILISVNGYDLVVLQEEEFLDLCQCCVILGQKLLQNKELDLKKKLLNNYRNLE